ncbi:hypothetical protein D3C83_246290 [compost metagenome]
MHLRALAGGRRAKNALAIDRGNILWSLPGTDAQIFILIASADNAEPARIERNRRMAQRR